MLNSNCVYRLYYCWSTRTYIKTENVNKPFGGIGGLANGVKAGIGGIVTGIPGIKGTPLMVPGVGTLVEGGTWIGLCWKFDITTLNYFKYSN